MSAPLHGLKVLELARVLAGPWAGQTLADFGAEVIKVERPGVGDDTRGWGPPFVEGADGSSLGAAYFHAANRGKRSVAADFTTPAGQALVLELARRSDVLIENFKVGGLERYGLDYASVAKVNPRIVYCSITGFGQDGPYAPRAGYDFIIQGMGGAMSLTGEPDGDPQKCGVAIADLFAGLYAVAGIQAALLHREKTGEGQHVDISLLDVQVGVLSYQAMNYLVSGEPPQRVGNAHPNIAPYDLFPVADGHVILAVGNDGQFARLCDILGAPEVAGEPQFASNEARVNARPALLSRLADLTRRMNREALLEACAAAHVPAGPINSVAEVFADPQVRHRGMRIDLADHAAAGGSIPGVRTPVTFGRTPLSLHRPSPALGADTEEALREIGFAAANDR
jgi:crotonobetainyl-CoA:carnitine CoA-transferase CaiB-like acyl-CoA transferase